MPEKELWIDGVRMLNGTSIKVTKDTSSTTNSTTTFDGVITEGTTEVSYTIDCSKVSYEKKTDYETLRKKLDQMVSEHGMITIREVKRPAAPEEPFTVVENYYDCLNTGGDYEIKPEERTVDNLKFTAASMEWYTE